MPLTAFPGPGGAGNRGGFILGRLQPHRGNQHPHPCARSFEQQINKHKCTRPIPPRCPVKVCQPAAVPLGVEHNWPRLASVPAEPSGGPESPAASWLLGRMASAPSLLTWWAAASVIDFFNVFCADSTLFCSVPPSGTAAPACSLIWPDSQGETYAPYLGLWREEGGALLMAYMEPHLLFLPPPPEPGSSPC